MVMVGKQGTGHKQFHPWGHKMKFGTDFMTVHLL